MYLKAKFVEGCKGHVILLKLVLVGREQKAQDYINKQHFNEASKRQLQLKDNRQGKTKEIYDKTKQEVYVKLVEQEGYELLFLKTDRKKNRISKQIYFSQQQIIMNIVFFVFPTHT